MIHFQQRTARNLAQVLDYELVEETEDRALLDQQNGFFIEYRRCRRGWVQVKTIRPAWAGGDIVQARPEERSKAFPTLLEAIAWNTGFDDLSEIPWYLLRKA